MSAVAAKTPTLYDLLARQWDFDVPVRQLAFDKRDEAIAFALADGQVAVAYVADEEAPQSRYRLAADTGRATLSPRRRAVPQIPRLEVDGEPLFLAAHGPSGFIAGGRDGRMQRLTKACRAEPLAQVAGDVEAIASLADDAVLVAHENRLTILDAKGMATPFDVRVEGRLSAMAIAADGSGLALCDARGISVQDIRAGTGAAWTHQCDTVASLAWSPDGRSIAAGLGRGGMVLFRALTGEALPVPNYPAAVSSLGWSADGRHLVTSGAYRVIVWAVGALNGTGNRLENVEVGRPGLVLVAKVAWHPRLPRIAAGYADGSVVVMQLGSRDELLVRGPGSGAISALAWSHDGQHLALGSEGGHCAIVTFPAQMFK